MKSWMGKGDDQVLWRCHVGGFFSAVHVAAQNTGSALIIAAHLDSRNTDAMDSLHDAPRRQ
jgi:hypothetical protein